MEPEAATEHNDNQYIWQHFAATAINGLLAGPGAVGQWRPTDPEQTERAGKIADKMVAEYRKRWPWQNPYNQGLVSGHYPAGEQHIPTYDPLLDDDRIAQDTLKANPEYGTFHKVCRTFGLDVTDAGRIWSAAETNHDAWLGLWHYLESKRQPCDCAIATDGSSFSDAQARAIAGAVAYELDGNGHSAEALDVDPAELHQAAWEGDEVPRGSGGIGGITTARASYVEGPDAAEAVGYIDPDNGQYVGPSSSRNPHVEYPTLPDMYEPADPMPAPERVALTEALAPAIAHESGMPADTPIDAIITNGVEYRRNAGGSYEAYRTVDQEANSRRAEEIRQERLADRSKP